MENEKWADLIKILLDGGFVDLEDLMPAIKKGTAKMADIPEDKMFKKN